MKSIEEMIPGEYYHLTYIHGGDYIIHYSGNKGKMINTYKYMHGDSLVSTPIESFAVFTDNDIRPATSEEIAWLEASAAAKKVVKRPKNLSYEIY